MKKLLNLVALSAILFTLSGCSQTPTDNCPTHEFTSTKIEDQYKLNFRMGNSYYDSTIFIYKDRRSLTSTTSQGGPYRLWNYYLDMDDHDYGEYQNYDPFAKYDDNYFKNHVLFCGFRDLKPDGELYLIGLDDKLSQDYKTVDGEETKDGDPYYRLNIDDVYPTRPENEVSKMDYRVTFFFISIETDNPSYTYEKYTVDKTYYYFWTVYLDEYEGCE